MPGRALIALFLGLLASSAEAASTVGEYRGYIPMNQILRERIVEPNTWFQLGYYVDETYDDYGSNLTDLLGTYKSDGGKLKNGVPNSINVLLWHVIFSGLSKDIAKLCGGEKAVPFRDGFAEIVRPLCRWPQEGSRSDAVLMAYWLAIMSYDAPITEFYMWKEFVLSPEMTVASAHEAIEIMSLSVFMNPYFLLRH